MPQLNNDKLVREAVAVFDGAELSLLAIEPVVQEKLGHLYDKVGDLEDDASMPAFRRCLGRD